MANGHYTKHAIKPRRALAEYRWFTDRQHAAAQVVGYRLRGSGDLMPKQRSAAELEGIDELQQTLKNMEPHLRKRALRPSLKKSAQTIVLPAARSNLQDQQEGGTGALAKELKVRAVPRSRVKLGSAVRLRNEKGSTDQFYGLFLEFGLTKTSPPRRHKSGKSTGDLPAQPFIRPALFDNAVRIQKQTIRSVRVWISSLASTKEFKLANKAVRDD
jgi:HK97 gp10 family phage protein